MEYFKENSPILDVQVNRLLAQSVGMVEFLNERFFVIEIKLLKWETFDISAEHLIHLFHKLSILYVVEYSNEILLTSKKLIFIINLIQWHRFFVS